MSGNGPAGSASYSGSHVDANVNAMFSGSRWTGNSIKWSYPDSPAEFEFGGASYASGEMTTFVTLSGSQRASVDVMVGRYAYVTAMGYGQLDETSSIHADIRISRSNLPSTAWGYFPGNTTEAGDIWLGNTRFSIAAYSDGTYEGTGVLHELGHAHGLKHSHEAPAMPNATFDCRSYTIMSYHSYPGSSIAALTIATGHHPQGPMAFDFEALHTMYGKSTVLAPAIYSFNASNGWTYRDGTPWFSPTVPCIHCCLWEPTTTNTFDVSSSNEFVNINLNRLQWSTFFGAMVASLGGGNNAPGNVCMPYSNDPFKFIIAGSGGGTFTFNTNLTGNKITIPGLRSAYTWSGSGRNWAGTRTSDSTMYLCTTVDFVSFSDVANVPVSDLVGGTPPTIGPNSRQVIWSTT